MICPRSPSWSAAELAVPNLSRAHTLRGAAGGMASSNVTSGLALSWSAIVFLGHTHTQSQREGMALPGASDLLFQYVDIWFYLSHNTIYMLVI